jgi:hypothetical protein
LKRFNEMAKRDAFGIKQYNFNPKPFKERLFSGEIASSVLKIESTKDTLDDFGTKLPVRRIASGGTKFWWGRASPRADA